MKTLTKVKIGISIVICLLLLAAIAKKTRENFQSEINPENKLNSVYGNRNPKEVSHLGMNNFGYDIVENYDNVQENLNIRNLKNRTRSCSLSNKTDEERNLAIQRDANEAQRQLNEFVKQKMAEVEGRVEEEFKKDPNPCSYLRFPAIYPQ